MYGAAPQPHKHPETSSASPRADQSGPSPAAISVSPPLQNIFCKGNKKTLRRSVRSGGMTGRPSTALHVSVTVPEIFSPAPAPPAQARRRRFGGGPFPLRLLPGMAGATDGRRASFDADILTRCITEVNAAESLKSVRPGRAEKYILMFFGKSG